MRMRDRLVSGFLLLIFASFPAFGQGGFTTVSGAIVDPNGIPWSGGTISAQLITQGGTAPTLNGQPFTSTTASGLLGPGGTFTMRLGDNGVIVPSTTTWQFTISIAPGVLPPLGKGPQSFVVTTPINCGTNTPATCTSNSMTITAALVPVPALSFSSGGGSSGTPIQPAVRLATSCPTSDTNCFSVNQDGQISIAPTWSANTSNGTTATLLTTNANDSGAQYLQTSTPQTNVGGIFTTNVANNASILAAFKIAGTLVAPGSCSGTNETFPLATSISVGPFTPANSGSGSILIAFAGSVTNGTNPVDLTAITFTDNNGNTWNNVLTRPIVFASEVSTQMAYVQNNNSGSTTVTATFSTTMANRSIFVCNFAGMASSGVLDAAVAGFSSSTTIFAGTLSTTGNDLLFQASKGFIAAFTVGTLGIAANTITNGSSDPSFTAANVGQKVVLGSQCAAGNGLINCVSPFTNPSAKIVAVNGPHNITVNSLLNVANTAPNVNGFTGWMVTAHDDGAQYASAFAKAITIPGSTLFLPCGTAIIGQQPFNGSTTAPFPIWNPNIVGCAGETGTVLVPSGDFNYGAAVGAFFVYLPNNNTLFNGVPQSQNQAIYGRIQNFSFWGINTGGLLGTGINLPMFSLANTEVDDVSCTAYLPAVRVMDGFTVRLNNVHFWLCGSTGLTYNDQSVSLDHGSVRNSYFQGSTTGIIVNGGHLDTYDSSIYGTGSCAGPGGFGVLVNGGQYSSHQDQYGGVWITGGTANLENVTPTASGCHASVTIAGGVLSAHKSQIDTFVMSAGSFQDLGGNFNTTPGTPWTNGTFTVTGGTFVGTGSITGVAVTAPKLVLSAGWGTTAAWTSLSGNTKRIRGTITASGVGQAANPTITYTYPTPFPSTFVPVCDIKQDGGTQAAVANPFTVGVPTATSVVFTYTGTPGAGNTLIVEANCDNP
jgi:hypothetical protein